MLLTQRSFRLFQGKVVKAKSLQRATRKTTAAVRKTTRTKRKKRRRACPADRPARRPGLRSRQARTSNKTPQSLTSVCL